MKLPRSTPFAAVLLALLALLPLSARAQDRSAAPWRHDVAITGNYFLGTLSQVQLLGRAHLSYSGARSGNDLLFSGFRVWARAEDAPWQRVGDDVVLSDIPFHYVAGPVYVHGFGRYESSQSLGLDARGNLGAGVGVTPVRNEDRLVRASLGAQIEHARFASEELTRDVPREGATRTVPRVVLFSNGWYRVKGTPVSFRYLGDAMMNPSDPGDRRAFLDAGADLKVTAALSARLSALYAHDSVVPVGVPTTTLRAGLGLAWSTPQKKN
jgi:hypothetical protein